METVTLVTHFAFQSITLAILVIVSVWVWKVMKLMPAERATHEATRKALQANVDTMKKIYDAAHQDREFQAKQAAEAREMAEQLRAQINQFQDDMDKQGAEKKSLEEECELWRTRARGLASLCTALTLISCADTREQAVNSIDKFKVTGKWRDAAMLSIDYQYKLGRFPLDRPADNLAGALAHAVFSLESQGKPAKLYDFLAPVGQPDSKA